MKHFYEILNKLLNGLLVLLGFSTISCERRVEYGTPHADFQINGQITEAESQKLLENIQIAIKVKNNFKEFSDTIYSDANGNFSRQYDVFPTNNDSVIVIFNDTTGEHQSKQVAEKLNYTNGYGAWYAGSDEININIELEK